MKGDRGFTFLAVMFSIILMGIFISAAAKQWGTMVRREKEAELLFRGQAIQRAIELFYRTSRPGLARYPRTLEELIKDPGSPAVRRYLRRLYPDPITGGDWVLVKDANDGVKGVHSASEAAPLKTAGFPEALKEFERKEKYSEWVFQYDPKQLAPGQPVTPVPPGTNPASTPLHPAGASGSPTIK